MSEADPFKEMKFHLGTLDDLSQQRRRLYTDWATQRMEPGRFAAAMRANLLRTREASEALERVLPQ